jgi:hypothetical protein
VYRLLGIDTSTGNSAATFKMSGRYFYGSLGVYLICTAGGCILACFELRIILASFSSTCRKIRLRNEIISSENVHLASGSVGSTG